MRIAFAILACVCLSSVACAQDSIVLRSSAKVEAVRAITLGDIAELSGPEALKHAKDIVADESQASAISGGTLTLDVKAVRSALARFDVKWGQVALSGLSCEVSLGAAPKAAAPAPEFRPPTVSVRDSVAARLAQQFGVGINDLKLSFDADRAGILDVPTAGRTVAVTATGMSDRIPLSIRVYENSKLVTEGTARVSVKIRRTVMVARGTIARGVRITDADVDQEVRWLSPKDEPATISSVVGAAARTRIDLGDVIGGRDVETPAVIRKGDLVAVDSVVGGIVIRMNNARALADGREGEEILVEQAASLGVLEKAGGKRGKPATVLVRVVGPGRAVVGQTN